MGSSLFLLLLLFLRSGGPTSAWRKLGAGIEPLESLWKFGTRRLGNLPRRPFALDDRSIPILVCRPYGTAVSYQPIMTHTNDYDGVPEEQLSADQLRRKKQANEKSHYRAGRSEEKKEDDRIRDARQRTIARRKKDVVRTSYSAKIGTFITVVVLLFETRQPHSIWLMIILQGEIVHGLHLLESDHGVHKFAPLLDLVDKFDTAGAEEHYQNIERIIFGDPDSPDDRFQVKIWESTKSPRRKDRKRRHVTMIANNNSSRWLTLSYEQGIQLKRMIEKDIIEYSRTHGDCLGTDIHFPAEQDLKTGDCLISEINLLKKGTEQQRMHQDVPGLQERDQRILRADGTTTLEPSSMVYPLQDGKAKLHYYKTVEAASGGAKQRRKPQIFKTIETGQAFLFSGWFTHAGGTGGPVRLHVHIDVVGLNVNSNQVSF